jgi:hypothetical protein
MPKPAQLDLDVYRGDDFDIVIRLRDSVTGAYLNLTSLVGKASIRAEKGAVPLLAKFTVTVMDQTTTPGGLMLSLPSAITTTLPLTGGVWDVQISNADGTGVRTYLAGRVLVTEQVTLNND